MTPRSARPARIAPVCPDCLDGYHEACSGIAYDPARDERVGCQCDDRRCNPPEPAGWDGDAA